MKQSLELNELVRLHKELFNRISEHRWSEKSSPSKWSRKEILGHLVDSALNNHRRFIVTQYRQSDRIFYMQDEWVDYQGYQDMQTEEIIRLWQGLNRQIARVIERIPVDKLSYTCDTGKEAPELHTLQFLIDDYIVHLKHHLEQIHS